ncbi:hypothetical protein E4U17_001880 [Claviceps sp. LM77 group G4]|nr:hypothetical protein E4U17_001880 [Claviceps sp. LM77 group G4]KAG6064570.1 hypothetical protein E4U16_000646 [Claviceps sp. LM84 group G4]
MTTGTRSAARGSEALEPPVNIGQQVPPAKTATDDDVAALRHQFTMAELREKIALR